MLLAEEVPGRAAGVAQPGQTPIRWALAPDSYLQRVRDPEVAGSTIRTASRVPPPAL